MSLLAEYATPRLTAVRVYRIAVVLLSLALTAVTALAVYFASSQAATPIPTQVLPSSGPRPPAGLILPPDPECRDATRLC
jgi:hypothetical protein